MRAADGQQHMAWVERAGRAGAAGRRADALCVEQKQQALALDTLEAEAHVAGEAIHGIAVECAVRDLGQAVDQAVAQGTDPFRVLVEVCAGVFEGCGHAHDGGKILRTRALAALLCAALDEVRQEDALTGVQHAGALRPVELVRGERQQVDVLRLDVNGQVSHGLHGVGVEQHARLAADCADLADRQDGADLVVGVHDGNQARVLANGALDLLRRHGADGADGEQLDGEALFFKLFQRVQHGVVLECGRNDVLFAFAFAEARGGEDGLIVGLAAAGGEVNFARGSVQAFCDAVARAEQRPGRLLADGMQA